MNQPRAFRIQVGLRLRGSERLDHGLNDASWPSIPALLEAAKSAPARLPWLLAGGEPTLRADLPELLGRLSEQRGGRLGLITDGLAIRTETALSALTDAGLGSLRLGLHSALPAAHDWLMGLPGAHRATRRAYQIAREAGLEVEGEITLSRPGLEGLADTVALHLALGARSVRVRRLRARGPAAADFYGLSPRWGNLRAPMSEALRVARERRGALSFQGFPACVLPAGAIWVGEDEEPWVTADPGPGLRWTGPFGAEGCSDCVKGCEGAAADYLEHFGRSELNIVPARSLHVGVAVSTICPCCRVEAATSESSRSVRQRMVLAAKAGGADLRITGGFLSHPELVALGRDACRLGFARVVAEGDGAALGELPPAALRGLRAPLELELWLYGPDAASHDAHAQRPGAFDATLRAVHALRGRLDVRLIGLDHGGQADGYARAWASGMLPGDAIIRSPGERPGDGVG